MAAVHVAGVGRDTGGEGRRPSQNKLGAEVVIVAGLRAMASLSWGGGSKYDTE